MKAPNNNQDKQDKMNRRRFLKTAGLGAAGLAAVSTGLLRGGSIMVLAAPPSQMTAGINPPEAAKIGIMPDYTDGWNQISAKPFGGFDFALDVTTEHKLAVALRGDASDQRQAPDLVARGLHWVQLNRFRRRSSPPSVLPNPSASLPYEHERKLSRRCLARSSCLKRLCTQCLDVAN